MEGRLCRSQRGARVRQGPARSTPTRSAPPCADKHKEGCFKGRQGAPLTALQLLQSYSSASAPRAAKEQASSTGRRASGPPTVASAPCALSGARLHQTHRAGRRASGPRASAQGRHRTSSSEYAGQYHTETRICRPVPHRDASAPSAVQYRTEEDASRASAARACIQGPASSTRGAQRRRLPPGPQPAREFGLSLLTPSAAATASPGASPGSPAPSGARAHSRRRHSRLLREPGPQPSSAPLPGAVDPGHT